MNFSQALLYFFREACLSLVRSWKVSLLAILTITMSLFLGGVFLLVTSNLESVISQWSAESKVVVYLEIGANEEAKSRLEESLRGAPWVQGIERVSATLAQQRFREAFPSLGDLLEGWGEEPLPASLEVGLDLTKIEDSTFDSWIGEIRSETAVSMVDDDRDWLEQLSAVVFIIRGLGMVLGAILLGTAIFTISSVIRLTAYLYRDEIAVMRLVGATEFFIRGPFYMEGLIQGLTGGLLAISALFGAYQFVLEKSSSSLLASVMNADFLGFSELALLVGVGGLAGVIGAVASLRKESLGETSEYPGWTAESD